MENKLKNSVELKNIEDLIKSYLSHREYTIIFNNGHLAVYMSAFNQENALTVVADVTLEYELSKEIGKEVYSTRLFRPKMRINLGREFEAVDTPELLDAIQDAVDLVGALTTIYEKAIEYIVVSR